MLYTKKTFKNYETHGDPPLWLVFGAIYDAKKKVVQYIHKMMLWNLTFVFRIPMTTVLTDVLLQKLAYDHIKHTPNLNEAIIEAPPFLHNIPNCQFVKKKDATEIMSINTPNYQFSKISHAY